MAGKTDSNNDVFMKSIDHKPFNNLDEDTWADYYSTGDVATAVCAAVSGGRKAIS